MSQAFWPPHRLLRSSSHLKDSSPQHSLFSIWEIQGISIGRLFWILLWRVGTQSCFLTYLFLKSMQLGIERTPLSLCFSDLYHTVTKFTHLKRADFSLHLFGSASAVRGCCSCGHTTAFRWDCACNWTTQVYLFLQSLLHMIDTQGTPSWLLQHDSCTPRDRK